MELTQVIQILGKVEASEGIAKKTGKAFRILSQRAGLFTRGEDWPDTFEVRLPEVLEAGGGYPPGFYVVDVGKQPFQISRMYGEFQMETFGGLWLAKVERPSWVPSLSGGVPAASASAAGPAAASKLEVKA